MGFFGMLSVSSSESEVSYVRSMLLFLGFSVELLGVSGVLLLGSSVLGSCSFLLGSCSLLLGSCIFCSSVPCWFLLLPSGGVAGSGVLMMLVGFGFSW